MAPRHRPFVWKWGENSRSPNGMKITSFFSLRACHIKRRCFALGFRQGGSEGKTEWEELRGTQRKKKREDCTCNGTGYTVDKSPMDVKQDKCAMISHPRPSVLSVRCVGQRVNFCSGLLSGDLGRESWTRLWPTVRSRVFHLPKTWELDWAQTHVEDVKSNSTAPSKNKHLDEYYGAYVIVKGQVFTYFRA